MGGQMHDARVRREQRVKALHRVNQAGPVRFAAEIFNLSLNFGGQKTLQFVRDGLLRPGTQQAHLGAVQQAEKCLQY